MVLTLIPCSDHLFESPSESHTHLTSEQHTQHHEDHDCSQDTCTPFCTCSCCGIALNSVDLSLLQLETPFAAYKPIQLVEKNYSLISQYLENIWQPPQA